MQGSTAETNFILLLLGIFAAMALLLAAVGIYAVISYSVEQRTHEIGIRMALGAGRANVLWLVAREVLVLVGLGIAVGVPITLVGSRVISSLLYGLSPADPVSMAGAATLLVVFAALAGYLPARRAANVDPMVALRYE